MRPSEYLFPLLVAATFAACAEGSMRKVGDDDDDDGSALTDGVGGSGGSDGGVAACGSLCETVGSAGCETYDTQSCEADCQSLYAEVPTSCHGDVDAYVECVGSGEFSCSEGQPVSDADCSAELEVISACADEATTTTTTTTSGGGSSCYSGLGCDPMDPDACASGEACDYTSGESFECFPPPNDAPVGGSCDAGGGPWCVHGAICVQGTCRSYCCSDADCSVGTCTVVYEGAVPIKGCM